MKRFLYTLCVILVGSSCLSSCFKDNETTVTLYNETTITGLQLTLVNRYVQGQTSTGKDTVYIRRLTTFPSFTIDHDNGLIFNTDSLPYDCDMKHVLINLTASSHTGAENRLCLQHGWNTLQELSGDDEQASVTYKYADLGGAPSR